MNHTHRHCRWCRKAVESAGNHDCRQRWERFAVWALTGETRRCVDTDTPAPWWTIPGRRAQTWPHWRTGCVRPRQPSPPR